MEGDGHDFHKVSQLNGAKEEGDASKMHRFSRMLDRCRHFKCALTHTPGVGKEKEEARLKIIITFSKGLDRQTWGNK